MNPTTDLTPDAARALLADSEKAARSALDVPGAVLFAVWGVFWIGGYGAVWSSVRDQQPYTGPSGWSLGVMAVLGVLAMAFTAVTITRASRGVTGASARAGMFYGLTWPVAFVAAEGVAFGIARSGGGGAELIGVLSATVPALVVAVIYCVSAAVWGQGAFFVAGTLLAVAAAVGAVLGPVDGPLALAGIGGLGFGLATAMSLRRR